MGSFKGNGQNLGPDRRRGAKARRRKDLLKVESLEDRVLLDAATPSLAVSWHPTSTNLADVENGPMANEGQDLIGVYQAYLHNGGNASQFPTQFPTLQFQGNMVRIGVNATSANNFNAFVTSLQN